MIRTAPTLAPLLAEHWLDQHREEGPKPHAFPTAFRYSDAASCERKLALKYLGHGEDDFDLPAIFVIRLGIVIHEAWQEAVALRYPHAEFEVASRHGEVVSGSCDLKVTDEAQVIVGELKTMGGTKFRRAVGAPNGRQQTRAEGPSWSHVVQLALNAKANDADEARLLYVSLEAVARGRGWGDADRFTAEWAMDRPMIDSIADEEVARMAAIKADVDEGFLPDRIWPGDSGGEGQTIENPATKVYPCGYCSVRDACVAAGPGVVRISAAMRRAT